MLEIERKCKCDPILQLPLYLLQLEGMLTGPDAVAAVDHIHKLQLMTAVLALPGDVTGKLGEGFGKCVFKSFVWFTLHYRLHFFPLSCYCTYTVCCLLILVHFTCASIDLNTYIPNNQ